MTRRYSVLFVMGLLLVAGCARVQEPLALTGTLTPAARAGQPNLYLVKLTCVNQTPQPQRFLIGAGIPTVTSRMAWSGSLELTAEFACPLAYGHDCFHAQDVILQPGEQRTIVPFYLELSFPKWQQNRPNRSVPVSYTTCTHRDSRDRVTFSGSLVFGA